MRDYLAILRPKPEDLQQHGILGQRWGRRRSEAQLAKETAERKASGEPVTDTKKAAEATKQTFGAASDESSSARYARLKGEAKGGGAGSWSEQDLKFFNARTEALNRVNKMFETEPSWISKASKTVLQNAGQKMMQDVANGIIASKVTGPVLGAVSGSTKQSQQSAPVKKAVAAAQNSLAAPKTTSTTTSAPSKGTTSPGMTRQQSLDYIKNYQASINYPGRSKQDYSPSGNFDLYKELREAGILKDDE